MSIKYSSYTEYRQDYITTTKIYIDNIYCDDAVRKAIDDGLCHWDYPNLIYVEQIEGTSMSDKCRQLIQLLGAEVEEED